MSAAYDDLAAVADIDARRRDAGDATTVQRVQGGWSLGRLAVHCCQLTDGCQSGIVEVHVAVSLIVRLRIIIILLLKIVDEERPRLTYISFPLPFHSCQLPGDILCGFPRHSTLLPRKHILRLVNASSGRIMVRLPWLDSYLLDRTADERRTSGGRRTVMRMDDGALRAGRGGGCSWA